MTLSILASIEQRCLFEQQSVLLRTAPFALTSVVAFAIYPFGRDATFGVAAALAAVLAALATLAIALVPWRRLGQDFQITPLLLFLGSIALLRDAHGGMTSGYAPLVLVPVLWAAVFGSARIAAATVAAVGLTVGLPIYVGATSHYPVGEARRAILLTVIAAVVAFVVQWLVDTLVAEIGRRQLVEQQLNAHRASEIHDDIVQTLTAAQLGLGLRDTGAAEQAIARALSSAQTVVAELLATDGDLGKPGSLRRLHAAGDDS